MDKATISAYAGVGCLIATLVFGSIGAMYGYHPWREARERRKAQRLADATVRRQPAFVTLGTIAAILFVATAIFAEEWLYFAIREQHPRLFWPLAAIPLLLLIAEAAVISRAVSKVLEDLSRARSDVDARNADIEQLHKSHKAEIAHKDAFIADAQKEILELRRQVENNKDSRPALAEGPLNVELIPSKGKSPNQWLAVTNKGSNQTFYAQCRLLENPRSKVSYLLTSYDLGWVNGSRGLHLSPNETNNLLVANSDKDGVRHTDWIAPQTFSGATFQNVDRADYYYHDVEKVEYLLEVTIIGEKSQTSYSQQFYLRPGKGNAMEMFPCEEVKLGDVAIAERARKLADDLYDFLKEIGSSPEIHYPEGSTPEEQVAILADGPVKWEIRMFWQYEHKFRQRISDFIVELRANGISPNFSEGSTVRNADMTVKMVREQADRLLQLSKTIELDSVNDARRGGKS